MIKQILVFCTVPDMDTADKIALELIGKKLAACVSRGERIKSVYRWEGVIESATEYNLTIKTNCEQYKEVERVIISQHPYDVPEIVAVPIVKGYEAYLTWIRQESDGRA